MLHYFPSYRRRGVGLGLGGQDLSDDLFALLVRVPGAMPGPWGYIGGSLIPTPPGSLNAIFFDSSEPGFLDHIPSFWTTVIKSVRTNDFVTTSCARKHEIHFLKIPLNILAVLFRN